MTEQEINAIVAVQRKYFQTGATLPVSFRIDALRRLYDAVSGSEKEIHDALERIRKSGISILGCIVNGIKVSEREINNPVTEKAKVKRAERRESAPFFIAFPECSIFGLLGRTLYGMLKESHKP